MPLPPLNTPPLPAYLPMGDMDDLWPPQGQLHGSGKTYSLTPTPGEQAIVIDPPLPSRVTAPKTYTLNVPVP